MTITEYIKHLEDIRAEHGELEVDTEGFSGRRSAREPVVTYRKILGKRESRQEFWMDYSWDPTMRCAKGQKVVRV